jgi:methionyl-tRNA formyltransferase
MKNLKIIFFGTSDRSTPILEALKINFDLILCITKKDTKVGRQQTVKETEVKKWSKLNNIEFLEISSLKNDDLEYTIKKIEDLKPDYGVVADFGFIIPKKIINLMNGQIINIHFSLLPKYRGASPIQHAILNGDKITGITYYMLDEKMDTGDIIVQNEYIIDTDKTSGELYDILFETAAEKLPSVIKKLHSNKIKPTPQDNTKATYTFSSSHPNSTHIFKEDAKINWDRNPEKIERSIRAFNPWPIAWTTLEDIQNSNTLTEKILLRAHIDKNLKVKIFKSHLENGKIKIDELQIEGKNKIRWEEFSNGYLKQMK